MIFKILMASVLTASIANAVQINGSTAKLSNQKLSQATAASLASSKMLLNDSALKGLQNSVQMKMGQDGNGGAGILKDGRAMTFYSAGLYTEIDPLGGGGPDIVPGLNEFLSFVQKFPYWSAQDKSKLMNTAIPSNQHMYFKVKEDKFTQTTKDRLLAEYGRVTGQAVEGLELFAVTDIGRRQTFLLPSFYSLQLADQAAILFHENVWLILGSQASYKTVVGAEMAFEAVYLQPNNPTRVMDLISRYGDQSQVLAAEANMDQSSGALNGLAVNGRIPFAKILGQDLMNCAGNTCIEGMITLNVYRLAQQYPKSLLLARLLESIQRNATYGVSFGLSDFPPAYIGRDYLFQITSRYLETHPDYARIDLATCSLNVTKENVGKLENCQRIDNNKMSPYQAAVKIEGF